MSKAAAPRLEPRKTPVQVAFDRQRPRHHAGNYSGFAQRRQVQADHHPHRPTRRRLRRNPLPIFPNKTSLLRALLQQHLDRVALAMETACETAKGASLAQMAEVVISAFVQAKFRNIDATSPSTP